MIGNLQEEYHAYNERGQSLWKIARRPGQTIAEKNVYKSLRTLVREEMGECRSGQVPQCDHDEYDISRDEAAATDQHDYEEAVRDDEQQV